MIEVVYTLRTLDDDFIDETMRVEHVPRVGDLVTFNEDRSFQVADVLWHLHPGRPGTDRITITAVERPWHEHIEKVLDSWRAS